MTRALIRVCRAGMRKWYVHHGLLKLWFQTQAAAARFAVHLAELHATGGGRSEVVVHRKDGTIGPRSTYPRSSDPKRTKG